MEVANLSTILTEFATSNYYNAILIDGPWGVGKTYYIRNFLKEFEKKNEYRMAYVSMFGKNSINEIHTLIYSKLSPVKNFGRNAARVIPSIMNIVPSVFGINGVGDALCGLDYVLKLNPYQLEKKDDNSKKKKDGAEIKQEKIKIVVIDDLERIDSKQIAFTEILGYFNSLLMQGIKIIVVCNVEELQDKLEYRKFAEKVFDREYKVTNTNSDVITNYFKGYEKLLTGRIVDEFDNNLRIAKRVRDFFFESLDTLQKIENEYESYIALSKVLRYCTYVVVDACSDKYSRSYNEEEDKQNINSLIGLEDNIDDFIFEKSQHIICYLRKEKSYSINYFDNSILYAFLFYYYYRKTDKLERELNKYRGSNNPLDSYIFLLSDEDKRKQFKKQIQYILGPNKVDFKFLPSVIKYMYDFAELSEIKEYEDKIIEKLSEQEDYDGNVFNLITFFESESSLKEFAEKLNKVYIDRKVNRCADYLRNCADKKDYLRLSVLLSEIPKSGEYLIEVNDKRLLRQEIIEVIRQNNFFMDNLDSTISGSKWDVVLNIIDIASSNNLVEEVKNSISKQNNTNSLTAKERIRQLLLRLDSCNL